jgi:putative hydrolase of the HAD superfamily
VARRGGRNRLDAHKTLFVDDSEAILDAAAEFGIRYCLGITNPDSGLAEKAICAIRG